MWISNVCFDLLSKLIRPEKAGTGQNDSSAHLFLVLCPVSFYSNYINYQRDLPREHLSNDRLFSAFGYAGGIKTIKDITAGGLVMK